MTTALTQYERLESGGIWRETIDAPPQDVTVSFGKATLVLTDRAGLPLTHWSLPAVIRLNAGTRPALFTPDPETDETLEIEDDLMVDAIETVRKAVLQNAPTPRRLRWIAPLAIVAVIAGAAAAWGPGVFRQQTLSAVPAAKRAEIGATILGHYQRLTGATCRNALGRGPLAKLSTRLMGRDTPGQIVVVQHLPQGAALLPGQIVMVDRALIEQLDDPAIVAGFILAAMAGRDRHDPLADVLDQAGLAATFQLYTTGDLGNDVLRTYAAAVQDLDLTPVDTGTLAAAFEAAEVPIARYAKLREISVSTETDAPSQPILTDGDWVRLQGICAI